VAGKKKGKDLWGVGNLNEHLAGPELEGSAKRLKRVMSKEKPFHWRKTTTWKLRTGLTIRVEGLGKNTCKLGRVRGLCNVGKKVGKSKRLRTIEK